MSDSEGPIRDILIGAFHAAVSAVSAEQLVPPWLGARFRPASRGRTWVIGAGKAAAAMAASVEAHWIGAAPPQGLVLTRYGHGQATRHIRVLEAGHPLPDAQGLSGARAMLELVRQTRPGDRTLALISGGGSSLLSLPAPGLTQADLAQVGRALLHSGAPITDINCVRKHLSQTLGGRLAEAMQGDTEVLVISDVAGDDLSVIASGPFAPDPSRFRDALDVLARWAILAPDKVMEHLARGAAGQVPETPKPGAASFDGVRHHLLGNGRTGLQAAARHLQDRGIRPILLGDAIAGEAREVAQVFAALAREIRDFQDAWQPPVALLSGGETSVTVRGSGRGGRNAEFQLALALALKGAEGIYALAADTDGIDGTSDAAGAVIGPTTLKRAEGSGLDPAAHLADNDAYGFFQGLGDLIRTGPTRTNANDFRALLIT